jgi:hypothetical protein
LGEFWVELSESFDESPDECEESADDFEESLDEFDESPDPFDESDPLLDPELDWPWPDAAASLTGSSAASKAATTIVVPGCWNRACFRILRRHRRIGPPA